MISESKLKAAVDLLIQACQPRRIILFGSQARGDADEDSDVDLMIVEDNIDDVGAEIVRLCRVIGPLLLPADIVVASQKHFDYWRETPGNVYFEAASEGKVLYEKAS